MTHTPTHTEKGLYGAKEQRVPPTSSFWSENGRKALKIKGRKALVRMRSPVQIRIAAPQKPLFLVKKGGFILIFLTFWLT